MSLITAIPTPEGYILASDTAQAVGQFREQISKVFRLNDRIAWSGTGSPSLVQRVQQLLAGAQDARVSLRELAPQVGNMIKTGVKELLGADFRTEVYLSNFNAVTQLHRADFVFVEWSNTPTLLHLNVLGSPVWVTDKPFFVGPGDAFIGSQFQKYRELTLNLSSATLLTYRLMEEAIDSGMFGLGGRPDIWRIGANGVENLSESECAGLKETAQSVRKQEVAIFERNVSMGSVVN